jgi:preprotein translocase subunit SecE
MCCNVIDDRIMYSVATDNETDEDMAKTSPAQFVRQVRQELDKVTWPSRRETSITTVMVGIMVALTAIFFVVVDMGLSWGVSTILGFGG